MGVGALLVCRILPSDLKRDLIPQRLERSNGQTGSVLRILYKEQNKNGVELEKRNPTVTRKGIERTVSLSQSEWPEAPGGAMRREHSYSDCLLPTSGQLVFLILP